MPILKFTVSDDEFAAYEKAAAPMPVSMWARAKLADAAGQSAANAAPKPAQARGPRKQTMEEYLESWQHTLFDDGRRRYGFVDRRFARQRDGSTDDPGMHAAFEQDLRANYPKQEIVEAPATSAYWHDNYWVRPTDPLPASSRDVASIDDNGRLRPTALPED